MIQPPSKAAAMPCDGRLLRWPQRGMETKFHISISDNMWLQNEYLLVSSWFRIYWCGCEFTYRGAAHAPHSFLINRSNLFKIFTMRRKRLHCTDSTYFHTERTFKTHFTFCAEARNRQLFGFDSRTLRNMLILQPPHPFQYSSLLASIWNTGQNTRSQKLPGIFVLRGFLFCTAVLRSCPTK